jgi:hypothetical protein
MRSLRQGFQQAAQKVGPFGAPLSARELAGRLGFSPPVSMTGVIIKAETPSPETRTILVRLTATATLLSGVILFAGIFNYNRNKFRIQSITFPGNVLSGNIILTLLKDGTVEPAVSLRPGDKTGPEPIFKTSSPPSPAALSATIQSDTPATTTGAAVAVAFEAV